MNILIFKYCNLNKLMYKFNILLFGLNDKAGMLFYFIKKYNKYIHYFTYLLNFESLLINKIAE